MQVREVVVGLVQGHLGLLLHPGLDVVDLPEELVQLATLLQLPQSLHTLLPHRLHPGLRCLHHLLDLHGVKVVVVDQLLALFVQLLNDDRLLLHRLDEAIMLPDKSLDGSDGVAKVVVVEERLLLLDPRDSPQVGLLEDEQLVALDKLLLCRLPGLANVVPE